MISMTLTANHRLLLTLQSAETSLNSVLTDRFLCGCSMDYIKPIVVLLTIILVNKQWESQYMRESQYNENEGTIIVLQLIQNPLFPH